MISKCFFIDKNGNEIYNEKIGSHVGLAINILESNEELKKIYETEKYRIMSTANFLQDICGYIRGGQLGEYKTIIFNSSTLSEDQRLALRGYHEEGYHFIDTYLEKLKQAKKNKYIDNDEER